MKPQEFLVYAQSVSGSATSGAAGFRSAISRAYYSVYLETRDWLRTLGIYIKGGNEHKQICIYLSECNVQEAIELAQLLSNLHQSRKEADYDLHRPHPETQRSSQLAVQRATYAQSVIAKCSAMPVAQQITNGISAYKKKTNQ